MSRTVVWIRHAKKCYANGKAMGRGREHDSPILEKEHIRIRVLRERLLSLYGEPAIIICSPFLRTRQTAVLLNGDLETSKIKVDENISEYLGNQKGYLDADEDTCSYDIAPIGESFDLLNKRVSSHIDMHIFSFEDDATKIRPPKNQSLEEKSVVIWIVTHGIFISCINTQIRQRLNLEAINYYPEELEGLVVRLGYGLCTISTSMRKSLHESKLVKQVAV